MPLRPIGSQEAASLHLCQECEGGVLSPSEPIASRRSRECVATESIARLGGRVNDRLSHSAPPLAILWAMRARAIACAAERESRTVRLDATAHSIRVFDHKSEAGAAQCAHRKVGPPPTRGPDAKLETAGRGPKPVRFRNIRVRGSAVRAAGCR